MAARGGLPRLITGGAVKDGSKTTVKGGTKMAAARILKKITPTRDF